MYVTQLAAVNLRHLRTTFDLARQARQRGDEPYGALLADAHGRALLGTQNTERSTRDRTAHAELNLVRQASARFTPAQLATCTLYASAEPCAMCAAAILGVGIGRVVFGVSAARLHDLFRLPEPFRRGADVLTAGPTRIEVLGPVLEDEAEEALAGY